MNLFQDNNKPQITFYFAECMEFPNYGEYKEFPTLAQAISLFEKCPGTLLNAVKCVGFILHDDSIYDDVKQPLMTSKHVLKDDINYISHYANTTLVQEAIKEAECYLRSKENSKSKVTTGMFASCVSLEKIVVSKRFNTSKVLDSCNMFSNCRSLPNYRKGIMAQVLMVKPVKNGGYLTYVTNSITARQRKLLSD